jgi:hypothetical protein
MLILKWIRILLFDFDADPVTGPAFHGDADLDPASQKDADPDRPGIGNNG